MTVSSLARRNDGEAVPHFERGGVNVAPIKGLHHDERMRADARIGSRHDSSIYCFTDEQQLGIFSLSLLCCSTDLMLLLSASLPCRSEA